MHNLDIKPEHIIKKIRSWQALDPESDASKLTKKILGHDMISPLNTLGLYNIIPQQEEKQGNTINKETVVQLQEQSNNFIEQTQTFISNIFNEKEHPWYSTNYFTSLNFLHNLEDLLTTTPLHQHLSLASPEAKKSADTIDYALHSMKDAINILFSPEEKQTRNISKGIDSYILQEEKINLFTDKGIDISKTVHQIDANPQYVRMIKTFIDNAIRYAFTPEQKNKKITIEGFKPQDKEDYIFKVIDNGKGLSKQEEQKQLMFKEWYSTADNKTQRLKKRFLNKRDNVHGLGLATLKQYITEQGGTTKAYNNEQGGATFEFTIPINPEIPYTQKMINKPTQKQNLSQMYNQLWEKK